MAGVFSAGTAFAGQFGPDAILGQNGAPFASGSVSVFLSDGVSIATLYTSSTKGASLSNPITTDSYGNATFWADPGVYVLSFTVGGINTTKTVEVHPWYTDAAWNVVVDTSTPASVLVGDCRLANCTSGNITENLPAPVLGARVKVVRTDSSGHSVTVATASGDIIGPSISGTSTVLAANQYVDLVSDGTNWYLS